MKEKITFETLPIALNQILLNHTELLEEIYNLKNSMPGNLDEKPHLTRQETAKFFNISLNCLNDWCRKGIVTPYKVGQRTYFKRSELVQVLFNQPKSA